MGSMTKDEINVSLFDEVKRLQIQVAELEKQLEWISVEDRLPTHGDKVLAMPLSGGDPRVVAYDENDKSYPAGYKGSFLAWYEPGIYATIFVATHWRPLPAPPEVSNDER